jgi:transposase
MTRKPCPSDVSDEEWNFVAPYLALIDEQAPQLHHSLREVFNTLRAGWPALARPGGLCPMTCRPGRWCISSSAAGMTRAALKRWSTTYAQSSGRLKAAVASPVLDP